MCSLEQPATNTSSPSISCSTQARQLLVEFLPRCLVRFYRNSSFATGNTMLFVRNINISFDDSVDFYATDVESSAAHNSKQLVSEKLYSYHTLFTVSFQDDWNRLDYIPFESVRPLFEETKRFKTTAPRCIAIVRITLIFTLDPFTTDDVLLETRDSRKCHAFLIRNIIRIS